MYIYVRSLRGTVAHAEQSLHVLPDTLQMRFTNVTNAQLYVSHHKLACRARDDYEVLRLPPGCTLAALKKRYREMAVALHPDKCLVSIPVVSADLKPEDSRAAESSDMGSLSTTCMLDCRHDSKTMQSTCSRALPHVAWTPCACRL